MRNASTRPRPPILSRSCRSELFKSIPLAFPSIRASPGTFHVESIQLLLPETPIQHSLPEFPRLGVSDVRIWCLALYVPFENIGRSAAYLLVGTTSQGG